MKLALALSILSASIANSQIVTPVKEIYTINAVTSFLAKSSYLGCFNSIALPGFTTEDVSSLPIGIARINTCNSIAVNHNARFFALYNGIYCSYGSNPAIQDESARSTPPSIGCNIKCGNDTTSSGPSCGGVYANSVYQVGEPTALVANTGFRVPTSYVNKYMYRGCYHDQFTSTDFMLTMPNATNIWTTFPVVGEDIVKSCYAQALNTTGVAYFAVQAGVYCFVGPITANLNLYGPIMPDNMCNSNCGPGNPNTDNVSDFPKCGGPWRNSVYQITSR